jgi:recombinational DNA repair protein (RecF pathway)
VKRVIGLVIICAAASCVAAPAVAGVRTSVAAAGTATKQTAAQREAAKEAAKEAAVQALAPADEYFGPLKQSVIGMRNEIKVLGWNYDVNHDIGTQTVATALLTERAVRAWATKYPHDGQVAKTLFLLQRLYTKVLTKESRDHAHAIAQWLFLSYAKSPQARQLHKVLAVEHLAPLPAPSTTTANAGSNYQSAFGPQYPSAFNAPAATPSAAASPH